jgi:hypothetical protein
VHSDVCGKLSPRSAGGAECFVTFIDDKSLALCETRVKCLLSFEIGRQLLRGLLVKVRRDNGGVYTSGEIAKYHESEGICHELTVSKSPQQNGVAEHLNRTLDRWR